MKPVRRGAIDAVVDAMDALARSVDDGNREPVHEATARLLATWQLRGETASVPLDAHLAAVRDAAPLAWAAVERAVRGVSRATGRGATDAVDVAHEALLAALDSRGRAHRGAYFTPVPLARFVVNAAADIVVREGWSGPAVAIDPAAGAGVFLALLREHPRFATGTRLVAHEKHVVTSGVLHARFDGDAGVSVRAVDTLRDAGRWSADDETLVVVGNPPFSGRSASAGDLATSLLRGVDPVTGAACESYSHIDGVSLGEKNPKWLQDDCVKFVRVAQWQLARARRGVVALVCTHGFLHHPTFRAMRHSLWRQHDGVAVLDLHGNVKQLEQAPDGSRDQNVFDVQQGIAVLVFWRGEGPARAAPVRVADLWGPRDTKLAALSRASSEPPAWLEIAPVAPRFLFAAEDDALRAEYARGLALDAMFTVCAPAIVTGRDRLLVAESRVELGARLDAMRDPAIDDDAFRARFLRERDGLDLAAARAATRVDPAADRAMGPCLYRPFDLRWLLDLAPWVERSRRAVMDSLRGGGPGQIAFLARRQSPPSREAPFVFVTVVPAVDGVIRSDNHGSESVLPLFVRDRGGRLATTLAPEVLAVYASCLGYTPAPRAVFAYAYALLHAPSYRARFATFLRQDFPRVALPYSPGTFEQLASLGESLIAAHTLGEGAPEASSIARPAAPVRV
ncbi:MAG: type ISP restriction/modification enzyme, partial [Deltaproteobacteria bacterium]